MNNKNYHAIERALNNFKNGQTFSSTIEEVEAIITYTNSALLGEKVKEVEKLTRFMTTNTGAVPLAEGMWVERRKVLEILTSPNTGTLQG